MLCYLKTLTFLPAAAAGYCSTVSLLATRLRLTVTLGDSCIYNFITLTHFQFNQRPGPPKKGVVSHSSGWWDVRQIPTLRFGSMFKVKDRFEAETIPVSAEPLSGERWWLEPDLPSFTPAIIDLRVDGNLFYFKFIFYSTFWKYFETYEIIF